MKHGPGWVILEEHHPEGGKRLLSVLSPRKSTQFVVQFMQQLYVDRYATIGDCLAFKKSTRSYSLDPMLDRYYPMIHLGHNPFFVGIRALDIELVANRLVFTYKIATDTSDPYRPIYEPRSQSITVDG